jgi:Protein of unknown function (DUF3300)
LIISIVFSSMPLLDGSSHGSEQSGPAPMPSGNPAAMQPGPAPGAATAEELQQLVAPIALYPDMLIAQILAASTYPTQVVEADRFMKKNPNLTGESWLLRSIPRAGIPASNRCASFLPCSIP